MGEEILIKEADVGVVADGIIEAAEEEGEGEEVEEEGAEGEEVEEGVAVVGGGTSRMIQSR